MRCIGNKIKLAILLLVSFVMLTGCGRPEDVVSAYETENYNRELYYEELFASDLCVAPEEGTISVEYSPSNLYAEALFDIGNADVRYMYQVHDQVYPASITKIMTALVAIKYGDLSETCVVSQSADADSFASDEQTCGIHMGDQLTLEDLLYGLLMYSGNDNAVAIAEQVGGSEEKFVQMMNDEAKQLAATNTHFVNSNGLHDENHYTTTYDLYLIFNECLKYEEFIKIIQSDTYTANILGIDGTVRKVTWEPTNFYATGEAKLPERVEIIGGKTGTTQAAGNCLILYEKDMQGNPYISIVMGADTKIQLYQDMTALIEDSL